MSTSTTEASTFEIGMHEKAIVVDGTCPGPHWRANLETWLAGGATSCVVSIGASQAPEGALYDIADTYRFIHSDSRLRLATSVSDIRAAKAAGQLAVVLQFQGTEPIAYEPALIEAYWRLGVRIVQLAYNRRGPVCDGCEEPNDAGLSVLGRRVIGELNRVGIVVDISHTGMKSARQAVDLSTSPVIASHSNAAAVHQNQRNLTDDVIRAIAGSGGVIGINGWPSFVSAAGSPTLDEYIDHMVYIGALVGLEHVALGLDYWNGTRAQYDEHIASGTWHPDNYPPPPWPYPQGIGDASGFPRLTERLLERGFAASDVRAILGENWLRVYGKVWQDESDLTKGAAA
ncbi:dipeptidase [Jatrophihabitans sp. DSM 45814]